jgi:hypothetical protein
MNRRIWIALVGIAYAGCSEKSESADATGQPTATHGDTTSVAPSPSDTAAPAGEPHVASFANVDADGAIQGVGVNIPVSFFENPPTDDPAFQSSEGVEMPASVHDKTFIQLLRINWLASGHGPAPYDEPHFDLHFYRGTKAEVTAISCPDPEPFPTAVLADGYEAPSTCVSGMGYHAWPSADVNGGTFTASIILGYAAQKMVFIEPMITRDFLLQRQDFERDIARPASAGGATTLYPSHFSATYLAATDTYHLEFGHFAPID